MKTKLFSLFFALVASVGTMFAHVKIGRLYYNLDATNHTAEVTYASSSSDNYSGLIVADIPSSVLYESTTYSVTSIGNYALVHCTSLTSVTIPNSVISIGYQAFTDCVALTSIIIPSNVSTISPEAFWKCNSLSSITVAEDNAKYDSRNNCNAIIESATNKLIVGGLNTVIPNSVTCIGYTAFGDRQNLKSIEIPNSVTSIENYAFYGCINLTSVTIGNGVANIGGWAFGKCDGLSSVTCYAMVPPQLKSSTPEPVNAFFYNVSAIPLYVPAGSVDAYKADDLWNGFGSILPISAKETETTGIQTTSTENTVDISWPVISGAASYELVIKDAGGNEICTLVFNAKGQLVSLVFHAPSRNNAPQQLQEAGFVYTITGLSSGKKYAYVFTATNNSGDVLRTESGSFYTDSPTGVEEIQNAKKRSTKVAKDGQILILRADNTYTIDGRIVQ